MLADRTSKTAPAALAQNLIGGLPRHCSMLRARAEIEVTSTGAVSNDPEGILQESSRTRYTPPHGFLLVVRRSAAEAFALARTTS